MKPNITLHELGELHQRKTKGNYRSTTVPPMIYAPAEWAMLQAAASKLHRAMNVDATPKKVADDMMDVVKYSELFWAQFRDRTGVVKDIKITAELFRRVVILEEQFNCPRCHLRVARVERDSNSRGKEQERLRLCCTSSKCNWKSKWFNVNAEDLLR